MKKILDECIEALGVCDIETAKNIFQVHRSRVYQIMNDKNTLQIGIHKFPLINLMI